MAARRRRRSPNRAIRVRMYDIGFGDCFLLFVPTAEGEKKILVDCGSIKKHTKSAGEIAGRVVEDVTGEDDTPRIDVVIATHRHRDHVSGFDDPIWATVEVGEVWLPWTEDPNDPTAVDILHRQHGFALALHGFLTRLGADTGLLDFALNALSNEQAMETLHGGFAGSPRRRFLPGADRRSRTLETDVLPGVRTFVLGPSRDQDVIAAMTPPAGTTFLRLASLANRQDGGEELPRPFDSGWELDHAPIALADNDREAIRSIGAGTEEALAAAIDSAVNGTSLMLVLQVGRRHLLLPGDAQWGTWKAALEDSTWRSLLAKTDFFKVGHHGSHNATPIEFVEETLRDDFWAMIPVHPHGRFKDIPRKPLVKALAQKSAKIVRSDATRPKAPFTREGHWYIETTIPLD